MVNSADAVFIGTGLAPLVAAQTLLSEGLQPAVLNPDLDFFRENSEMGFDPLWPLNHKVIQSERVARSQPQATRKILEPVFPGSLQDWPKAQADYHDAQAPHLRARTRLWLKPELFRGTLAHRDWEMVEELFVRASDLGLHPAELESWAVANALPGFRESPRVEELFSVSLPTMVDVDVGRYRFGVYDYVRERLSNEGLITNVQQVNFDARGVGFYFEKNFVHIETPQVVVFWTPRLETWVEHTLRPQAKRDGVQLPQPKGVRHWEEWTLLAPEGVPQHPGSLVELGNCFLWDRIEGAPDPEATSHEVSLLMAGPLLPEGMAKETPVATTDSFADLDQVLKGILGWEEIRVRGMRPRGTYEWSSPEVIPYKVEGLPIQLCVGCEGAVTEVVDQARTIGQGVLKDADHS